jgi:hypothetical protein
MHYKIAIHTIPALLVAVVSLLVGGSGARLMADPGSQFAWGENIGWLNAGIETKGLSVRFDGVQGWLTGYVWGENIGWVKVGSDGGGPYTNTLPSNWGVNVSATGSLTGYAWGENVGWVNFGHPYCNGMINIANGSFSGYVWGENIGWINLGDWVQGFGLRTVAFETQPQGTPNWWLQNYGVNEGYDAGDGVPAWKKFVMDTDPTVSGDVLRSGIYSDAGGSFSIVVDPSSANRYYTLQNRVNLVTGSWSNVVGLVGIRGTGGALRFDHDHPTSTQSFYRVVVSLQP